jgi:hypothetical protein
LEREFASIEASISAFSFLNKSICCKASDDGGGGGNQSQSIAAKSADDLAALLASMPEAAGNTPR